MKQKFRKQVALGYNSEGKQIRKWFYGDSKTELRQNIERYKREAEKLQNPSDVSFKDYADQWFRTYKANRAKQTQDMYTNALNKCSRLDPLPLKKITRSMCQEAVNGSWEHPRAAKILADTMKQIFKCAIRDGIIPSNPAEFLELPKRPARKFYLLTEDDLNAVAAADLSDQDRLLIMVLQVFGLRPGEALALQKTDFDLKNKVLRITKALEMTHKESRIKDTKTGIAREIPIPEALISLLRKRLSSIHSFFVFEKATGGLYTKNAYRRLSERVHRAINVQLITAKHPDKKPEEVLQMSHVVDLIPDFTLYCFRHRRATDLYYLCQKGTISTKKAAELMGHSELIFLTTYSHIDDSKEKIEEIYSDLKVENL